MEQYNSIGNINLDEDLIGINLDIRQYRNYETDMDDAPMFMIADDFCILLQRLKIFEGLQYA